MPKRRKKPVENVPGARNRGGRPRLAGISGVAARLDEPVEPPAAPEAPTVIRVSWLKPLVTATIDVVRAAPAPAAEPAAEPSSELPSIEEVRRWHREMALERQLATLRGYDNSDCDCRRLRVAAPGDPDFVEHSMFCRVYKCYACEIGCCNGRHPEEDQSGDWNSDMMACECMGPDWDGLTAPRNRLRIDVLHERSWWGGPLTTPSGRDWTGRSLKQCAVPDCPCDGMSWGTYIPLCPFRRHAVSGTQRGELEAERRGYAIPHALYGFMDTMHHFGEHLPRHPDDTS